MIDKKLLTLYEELLAIFPDTKVLLSKQQRLKIELRQTNRKLRTHKHTYGFLLPFLTDFAKYSESELTIANKEFEKHLKTLFKQIGYSKVYYTGNKTEREDLQIWFDDHVIIIEVKNLTGNTLKDADVMQVDRRKNQICQYPEFNRLPLKGLTIINVERNTPLVDRKSLQLHRNQLSMLMNSNTGVITTKTLLDAFIAIKTDKLTFDDFDNMLHQNGLIEFKKRTAGLKVPTNSD